MSFRHPKWPGETATQELTGEQQMLGTKTTWELKGEYFIFVMVTCSDMVLFYNRMSKIRENRGTICKNKCFDNYCWWWYHYSCYSETNIILD